MKELSRQSHLTDIVEVKKAASIFAIWFKQTKMRIDNIDFHSYSYTPFAKTWHLDNVNIVEIRSLYQRFRSTRIADIGAADGDMAFFYDCTGASVDITDRPSTNINGLRGAAAIKREIRYNKNIEHINLGDYFQVKNKYELLFFTGILNYLQNLCYLTLKIIIDVKIIVLSTKLAALPSHIYGAVRQNYDDLPLSYLLDAREANGDTTNYWVFTEGGMKRLIERTGWSILDCKSFRNQERTDSVSVEGDCRVFRYLESKVFTR